MDSEKIKSKLSSVSNSMNTIWDWAKNNKIKVFALVLGAGYILNTIKDLNKCRVENKVLKEMLYERNKQ